MREEEEGEGLALAEILKNVSYRLCEPCQFFPGTVCAAARLCRFRVGVRFWSVRDALSQLILRA